MAMIMQKDPFKLTLNGCEFTEVRRVVLEAPIDGIATALVDMHIPPGSEFTYDANVQVQIVAQEGTYVVAELLPDGRVKYVCRAIGADLP